MTLPTYTPNQYPYKVSTTCTLWFLIYSPDKILKVKVSTARSKVISRSHDIAHLHSQPMTLPSFNVLHLMVSDIYPGEDFQTQDHNGKVKSSRSHTDVAHLHPQPMSLTSFNLLHLMVSEIQPRQHFSQRLPTHTDTMGENNTSKALKGYGVKN